MKIRIKKLYIFCLCILVTIVYGCVESGIDKSVRDCRERPFNRQETRLIDSLSFIYDSVLIRRYDNQICDAYGNGDYHISLKYVSKNVLTKSDSINRLASKLAVIIYSNLLEDSISYETPKVIIKLISGEDHIDHRTGITKVASFVKYTYKKDDLEHYCGFKVVKRNGIYLKKPVRDRYDNLRFKMAKSFK
jgi:hypothetical protein